MKLFIAACLLAVSLAQTDKFVQYVGCYMNSGSARINGHVPDVDVEGCAQLASDSGIFGMEYPQGYETTGHAQCLVLDHIPSDMEVAPESDCEHELDSAGRRLGNGNILAVYQVVEAVLFISYQGCYVNDGNNRITGHIVDVTIDDCARLATNGWFGMEYPEGYVTDGNAQCLPLNGLPNLVLTQESDCEAELDSQGRALGSGNRLVVYSRTLTTLVQTYEYQGCFSSTWDRAQTPDVASNTLGVQQCRDNCASAGFQYFGMECPHIEETSGIAEVHCECSNFISEPERIDDTQCQQYNVENSHCIGPYEIITDFGTYYLGAHGTNTGYIVEATVATIAPTTTIPHVSREDCDEDTDTLAMAAVRTDQTTISGDLVTVQIDYPAYMDLLSIQFVGPGISALDTWTIAVPEDCSMESSATQSFSWITLTELANITRNGEYADFNILTEFVYYTQSDLSGSTQMIVETKEVKLGIRAPRTAIIEVTAPVQPATALLYDISGHGILEEEGNQVVFINFRTFLAAGHIFTGGCLFYSDFFDPDTAECSLSLDDNDDTFVHPEEGPGTLQYWSVRATNPDYCEDEVHTEHIQLDLTTETGIIETVEFAIEMKDEVGHDCRLVIGEFQMERTVYIGDSYGMVPSDNLEGKVFYINRIMYFTVKFETNMPPTSTTLDSMSITQNNVEKCGDPDTNPIDCMEVAGFSCEACNDMRMSEGAIYNFSVILSSDTFDAIPGFDTDTLFYMEFSFEYTERRQLTKLFDVYQLPIRFSLRDFDCHKPDGLLAVVKTVDCDMVSMTKRMVCSESGWEVLSHCSAPGERYFTLLGLITAALILVAIMIKFTSSVSKGFWGQYQRISIDDIM